MLIRIPSRSQCPPSAITAEPLYLSRRRLLGAAGLALGAAALPAWARAADGDYPGVEPGPLPAWFAEKLPGTRWRAVGAPGENLTPYRDATHYNNFYEFGPDKGDPAANAATLPVEPWTVLIDGAVGKPGRYDLADLVRPQALEERIYRLRCVEGWSMVIPWLGFPLGALLKRAEPGGNARYVAFETLLDPAHLPGQRAPFGLLDWPYREGLRLDEAMHPLTLLAVGMYGRVLAKQNGAPLRLVVPWKYGFKSIKSIVRISLVERQPVTTWNRLAPQEYGFYANVNPAVDHPRWSQKRERRLPSGLFSPNLRDTLPFNGYAEEVAGLYAGMDLRKDY